MDALESFRQKFTNLKWWKKATTNCGTSSKAEPCPKAQVVDVTFLNCPRVFRCEERKGCAKNGEHIQLHHQDGRAGLGAVDPVSRRTQEHLEGGGAAVVADPHAALLAVCECLVQARQ